MGIIMSDYQMAALFFQIAEAAQAGFANFMALITAMVVVSWFVGSRLSRGMAIAVLVIYTVACFGFGNEIFSLYGDLARLGSALHARGAEGAIDLGWLGPVRAGSADAMAFIPYTVLAMMLAAYIATFWFFLHARRRTDNAVVDDPSSE
jgi:hypothetical protein